MKKRVIFFLGIFDTITSSWPQCSLDLVSLFFSKRKFAISKYFSVFVIPAFSQLRICRPPLDHFPPPLRNGQGAQHSISLIKLLKFWPFLRGGGGVCISLIVTGATGPVIALLSLERTKSRQFGVLISVARIPSLEAEQSLLYFVTWDVSRPVA